MVEPLPEVLPMEELPLEDPVMVVQPLEAMAVNSDKKHLTKFSTYL